MRIKKESKSVGVLGKILNLFSNSKEDTYSCDYINNKVKDVYSEQEIKTNKVWVDGKPIYRISKELMTPSETTKFFEIYRFINLNLGKLTDFKAIIEVVYSDTTIVYYSLSYDENDSNHFAWIALHKRTGSLQMKVGSELTNQKIYLTLEYTKTTD